MGVKFSIPVQNCQNKSKKKGWWKGMLNIYNVTGIVLNIQNGMDI